MDSVWTWALGAVAVVALILSAGIPRAWLWIGCMTVSFVLSTLFLDYSGHPELHPWLTFSLDALVFMIVLHWHRENWELAIAVAFLASVFASLLRIWNVVQVDWIYASMLELANLAALLSIIATGILDRVGRREHSSFHRPRAVLRSPRNSA